MHELIKRSHLVAKKTCLSYYHHICSINIIMEVLSIEFVSKYPGIASLISFGVIGQFAISVYYPDIGSRSI